MAPWVKHLLCKHEILSLIPRSHMTVRCWSAKICSGSTPPRTWGGEPLEAHWKLSWNAQGQSGRNATSSLVESED